MNSKSSMKYIKLVEVYEALDSTTKRLEKTSILAKFLRDMGEEEPKLLPVVTLMSLGRIFPTWSEEEMGLGLKLLMKAIALVVGVSPEDVENMARDAGDMGLAAEKLFKKKKQTTLFTMPLTIEKVHSNLVKIANISGNRAQNWKMEILRELFSSASPVEAKYITRTVLEELRVGVGEGTIRDAIAEAFGVEKSVVERAHMLTNDLGRVAEVAKEEGDAGLKKLTLKPGKPVKLMLAQLSPGIKISVEEMGWALCETKYDGIRVQIHRLGDEVNIFTRRLENISNAVPEIIEYIKKLLPAREFIVEGEIIVTRDGKPISFQYILQRVRRKYDIEKMREKVPLKLFLFDVLYYDGPQIDTPFYKRRQILESIVTIKKDKLELSSQVKTTPEDVWKAEDLFTESLKAGHEGIMIKDPNAPYMPGIRGKKMLKLKEKPETLDLVIVGGTYGKGKRAHVIGSYLLAVRDENNDFKTLAHAATGMDDQMLAELSEMVEPLIVKKVGRKVEISPSVILEIAYSEIVKSPEYESGYSDTVKRVESMFKE